MLMGGALGGGTAAAISLAAAPVGAGVLLGSTLAAFLCREEPQMPAPQPVAAVTPPAPAPVMEMDSDGDGVSDSLDRCPGTPPGTKVDANGCPEILLTLTGVNFKFDSAELEPSAEQMLAHAVQTLNEAPAVNARVEGHTDSVGTDAYNLDLSQRRADSVREYLIARGIPATRLTTAGKGEAEPVAPNTTAEGRFQNRRVEFRVVRDAQ